MGAPSLSHDSPDVLQGVVYTLLEVFDATRDLYQTLINKDKRELEQKLRSKGYSSSRKLEFIDDAEVNGNRAILTDKLMLLRRYEDGLRDIGPEFAVGDAFSQVSLQSEVIKLQGVLLTTFLYGPTSSEPLPQQLSTIDDASHAAATAAVDMLNALERRLGYERLVPSVSVSRRGSVRAPSMPGSFHQDEEQSTALTSYRGPARMHASSPANTTILSTRRPEFQDIDTGSSTSYRTETTGIDSPYCSYARQLDRYRAQQLSSSIIDASIPSCPDCGRTLHLSPNKTWEVIKKDTGFERCFQITNRFVVKCHRSGPDAGYACILCSKANDDVTICGDVKALVKHICEDHKTAEFKAEEDITEVVELALGERRRDSAPGRTLSRSSRRSASVSSRRRGSKPHIYDREVEALEIRVPRRGA